MPTPTIIILIDGLDPQYLDANPAPALATIARAGFHTTGRGLTPSVTNVNNVSLITAGYPETHGITSNYWLDRHTGQELYMESGEFLRSDTMFRRAANAGMRSLLITAKDKLRSLLSPPGGAPTVALSAEAPPQWAIDAVGQPPPIYSLEVNRWVLDAGRAAIAREPFDLIYLTTTDYAMHTYPPTHPESARHITLLDQAIAALMSQSPNARILITADHGMSDKTQMLHLPDHLAQYRIKARAIPVIKDRYTVHHSNLGGSIYIHLDNPADANPTLDALRHIPGVDQALPAHEAAQQFRLMPDRIGDILVLADAATVFGNPAETPLPPGLRSHGSAHETQVPIIAAGPGLSPQSATRFQENLDIGRYIFEEVLPQ